jgi:copper(I)-binding protein
MKTSTLTSQLAIGAVALMLALSGCAGASKAPVATASPAAHTLSITDAWVKAADTGMSAAFGTLENSGPKDVTVVSAQSPASSMLQLHETTSNDAGEMVMREKKSGFVVPAGGSLELAPGGNHIMLMDLTNPIKAGDEATFTLTLSDGSTYEFTAAAKDFTGANETYTGGMNMDKK